MYNTELSMNVTPHLPFSLLGEHISEANLDRAEKKLPSPLKQPDANKQINTFSENGNHEYLESFPSEGFSYIASIEEKNSN